jgi:simple sugar transport system ATP-binding protein
LVGELALWENLLLGCDLLSDAAPRGVLEPNGQRSRASASLADFGVQPQEPAMAAANLSGGNQQRLVLARELSRPRLRAVIAANPTRGLDFGATRAIHGRLRELAARGVAILVFSTDLDEVQVLATRIAVLFRGRLHHLPPGDADRGRIGALMAGLGGAD